MKGQMEHINAFTDWNTQIEKLYGGGEDIRAQFFTRVRASAYLVPKPPEGTGLALLSTQNKELYIPAFTAQDEFQKWVQPQGGVVVHAFEMLHHIIVDDEKLSGIVINPFGKQLIFNRRDLLTLENAATGMTHERVEHHGKVIIEGIKCPPALARAFVGALKNSPGEVFEAYILSAKQENEKKPHMLFLIDFNGDRKLLFPPVAKAIQPYMKPGVSFELLKASYPLLLSAREKSAPVFKR